MLMFFFLPCDAQTRDLKYERDLPGGTRKHLGAVGESRAAWRVRVRSCPMDTPGGMAAVCGMSSCTGVAWPVWACTKARWSGGASLVYVPTYCVTLSTVRGSQIRADRYIPV